MHKTLKVHNKLLTLNTRYKVSIEYKYYNVIIIIIKILFV